MALRGRLFLTIVCCFFVCLLVAEVNSSVTDVPDATQGINFPSDINGNWTLYDEELQRNILRDTDASNETVEIDDRQRHLLMQSTMFNIKNDTEENRDPPILNITIHQVSCELYLH